MINIEKHVKAVMIVNGYHNKAYTDKQAENYRLMARDFNYPFLIRIHNLIVPVKP